jgi:hypothetical protein
MNTDPSRPTGFNGDGSQEGDGDGKQHIEDDGVGAPTVTVNRAWSLGSGETTGDPAEWTNLSVLESRVTGNEAGLHSRRSFDNP